MITYDVGGHWVWGLKVWGVGITRGLAGIIWGV